MNNVRAWFRSWLGRHQSWNQHRWDVFEAPGRGIVYLPWIEEFQRRGITEDMADSASKEMAKGDALFPEKHLPRLLAILAPIAEARKTQADRDHSRLGNEEADTERASRRAARTRWEELPEAERAGMLARTRERHPHMATLASWVELMAIEEWRGVPIPEIQPAPQSPKPASTADQVSSAEAPLTPSQRAMLGQLPRHAEIRLASVTPGRRREILEPYKDRFDKVMLNATIDEILYGYRPPEHPAEATEAEGPASIDDPRAKASDHRDVADGPVAQGASIAITPAAEGRPQGPKTPHQRGEAPVVDAGLSIKTSRFGPEISGRTHRGTPAVETGVSGSGRGRGPPSRRRGASSAAVHVQVDQT